MTLQDIDLERIKKLHTRSVLPWVMYVALDWAVIMSTFLIAGHLNNPMVYFMAALVIGNRIHALAVMGHDAAHFALSRVTWMNDGLSAVLVFWPLGMSLEGYRTFHMNHHRYVGTPEDPERIHKRQAAPEYDLPLPSRSQWIFWILRDMTGYSAIELVRLTRLTMPQKKKDLILPVSFQILFISISVIMGQYWIPILWYYSYAVGFWISMRFRIWIEHVGINETHRVRLHRWQELLCAPHWISYHFEHHKFPTVPCWNLPELRSLDQSEPILSIEELMTIYRQASGPMLSEK